MKRKLMRVILAGVCAVCLIACGKSEQDAASEYYQEQFGMSEEDADELADALFDGNGGVQTEAAPEAEAELPLEYVEPAAADFEYNYDVVLGGVVITEYKGEAEAIRIPAEIDGELVVKVRLVEISTTNHSGITHVELPDGITDIDNCAFHRCVSLTEITIPGSVTSIGQNAFANCSSLRNLTIPDDAEIVAGAFYGCDGLTVTYQGQEYNYANDPNHWWQ